MRTKWMLVAGLAVLISFGCVATQGGSGLDISGKFEPSEVGVILLPAGEDDQKYADCVGGAMQSASTKVNVMPLDEFREAMYPWFERETEQGSIMFAQQPIVRKRIRELGIRYLIRVSGDTSGDKLENISDGSEGMFAYRGGKGSFFCGAGFGAGGCFGVTVGDRESNISVDVWDLMETKSVGGVSVKSSGTSVVPAFVLPIPFIAPTESSACHDMGQRLAQFVTGGGVESHQPGESSNENPINE